MPAPAMALVPPGVVTVNSTVPAPAGAVAEICVVLTTVKAEAALEPKLMPVAPVKSVPVKVTTVLPVAGPVAGDRDATVGAVT